MPSMPAGEVIRIIVPRVSTNAGSTSCAAKKTGRSPTAIGPLHICSLIPSTLWTPAPISLALWTKASSRPNSARATATAAAISRCCVTSQAMPTADPPRVRISPATSSARSLLEGADDDGRPGSRGGERESPAQTFPGARDQHAISGQHPRSALPGVAIRPKFRRNRSLPDHGRQKSGRDLWSLRARVSMILLGEKRGIER